MCYSVRAKLKLNISLTDAYSPVIKRLLSFSVMKMFNSREQYEVNKTHTLKEV